MGNREKADRAKLFVPFDAVKGFREALAEKERVVVPKIELSEEMKEELDRKFHQVQIGSVITVVAFQNGEYVEVKGMVSKFSPTSRALTIVNTKIRLDDICKIELGDRPEFPEKQ